MWFMLSPEDAALFLEEFLLMAYKTQPGKVMRINTIRDISSFRLFRTSLRKAFENYQSRESSWMSYSPGELTDLCL